MEQQRYGFNKEQGTKGTAKRAAISLPFYLFHIWPGRVKAHHIFFVCVWLSPQSQWLYFCARDKTGLELSVTAFTQILDDMPSFKAADVM